MSPLARQWAQHAAAQARACLRNDSAGAGLGKASRRPCGSSAAGWGAHKHLLILLGALCALVLSMTPALAGSSSLTSGSGSVTAQDDNDVTAAEVRANYGRRFPYAQEQARQDEVRDKKSEGATRESFKAYERVRQFCVGGYLDELNAISDALSQLDQALGQKLGGKLDDLTRQAEELAGQKGQEQRLNQVRQEQGCVESMLSQLGQQVGQIQQLNRNDLATQVAQQNQVSRIQTNTNCANSYELYQIQQKQWELDRLMNTLNALASVGAFGDNSTETNGKACAGKCTGNDGCLGDKHHKYDQDTLFHYYYTQENETASVDLPTRRDTEALHKGLIKTFGLPLSDTQFQIIDRNNKQRLLELAFDPERWMWTQTAAGHMQMTAVANSIGGAAEAAFKAAYAAMNEALINVANERSAEPLGTSSGHKSLPQAVYIVQQMYKFVFVPMAILFLLPGAILTQVKGMVGNAFLGHSEDAVTPFDGILRALIAIFLIPATQLIVSYAIDIGNGLAWAVRDPEKPWIQENKIIDWAKEQTFNTPEGNVNNSMMLGVGDGGANRSEERPGASMPALHTGGDAGSGSGSSALDAFFSAGKFIGAQSDNAVIKTITDVLDWLFGGSSDRARNDADSAGQGKSAGQREEQVVQENQLWLSGALQVGFNGVAYLMGNALSVLCAYQLVFMCYLLLVGPIAACFFAWPAGIGSLFRKVFANWLDAVVVLALWRFWWCVILAVMTQRIIYEHPNPGSATEMIVFDCFLALLLYVPFQPFSFNPGAIAASLLEKMGQGGGHGASAAAGGGGESPGSSSHVDSTVRRSARATGEFSRLASTQARAAAAARTGRSTMSLSGGRSGGGEATSGAAAGPGQQRGRSGAQAAVLPPPPVAPLHNVAGSSAAVVPPPVAGAAHKGVNTMAGALSAEFPGVKLSFARPGDIPSVPLSPGRSGCGFVINTDNIELARRSLRAWQSMAPFSASAASLLGSVSPTRLSTPAPDRQANGASSGQGSQTVEAVGYLRTGSGALSAASAPPAVSARDPELGASSLPPTSGTQDLAGVLNPPPSAAPSGASVVPATGPEAASLETQSAPPLTGQVEAPPAGSDKPFTTDSEKQ